MRSSDCYSLCCFTYLSVAAPDKQLHLRNRFHRRVAALSYMPAAHKLRRKAGLSFVYGANGGLREQRRHVSDESTLSAVAGIPLALPRLKLEPRRQKSLEMLLGKALVHLGCAVLRPVPWNSWRPVLSRAC
jgi:hypothetical protein